MKKHTILLVLLAMSGQMALAETRPDCVDFVGSFLKLSGNEGTAAEYCETGATRRCLETSLALRINTELMDYNNSLPENDPSRRSLLNPRAELTLSRIATEDRQLFEAIQDIWTTSQKDCSRGQTDECLLRIYTQRNGKNTTNWDLSRQAVDTARSSCAVRGLEK